MCGIARREKRKVAVLSVERVVIGTLGILIKNRLRGIVHKLRLIHSVQVFVCRSRDIGF